MSAISKVKPRPIRPGDRVGIVSTSSPVTPDQLERLTGYFRGRGYGVRVADGVCASTGYLGGSAARRASGVREMFAAPDIALVLPATGGTGASHLVDMLDYRTIRRSRKLFAAFSNPTVLNNSILAGAGLATVHGTSGVDFFQKEQEPGTECAFWDMISGPVTGFQVAGPDWRVYRNCGRRVSGPVMGGNLTAFQSLAGTAWMPPTASAILLLEAMTATYEQVDAALSQLRLAGVFEDIAALVIGAPADWDHRDAPDADTDELILRCVGGTFPVITNVACGHQPRRIQLPVGCAVEFDFTGLCPALRYLEDLVDVDG